MSRGLEQSGSEPGSAWYDFRKWLEKMARPIPKWNIKAEVTGAASWQDRAAWQIGFPPYDEDRQPRRHLPAEPSGRVGFPPYDDIDVPRVVTERGARMTQFPPYDKAAEPLHHDNVGLPPYNQKPPRTKSYIKQHDDPRPGFPPYQEGVYRVSRDLA